MLRPTRFGAAITASWEGVNHPAIGNTGAVLSPRQGADVTVTGIVSAIIVGLIIGGLDD